MKKWTHCMTGLVALTALFAGAPILEAAEKASAAQVPVTYPGDTEATIARRAQWIEGAKKEGMLTWWGALNPSEAREIIAAFNSVYPSIRVDYWRGRGEETGAKLESEYAGSRYTVDVLWGGEPHNYARWAKNGLIQKVTDYIIGLEKFDRRAYGKRGDWIVPAFAPKIPQFNTRLLAKADAPKDWDNLLDPKWRGHLGTEVEPDNWATMALCEGGWGVEKMEAFLGKLKQQRPRFVHGGSAAHSLLIAGEFKILAMGNLRHVLISQKKHAPVDWIRTNPVLLTGAALIMAGKGPHPNAAKLFLEWNLSPQGRMAWAESSQNYVPGTDTPMSHALEGLTLIYRTEEVIREGFESGLNKKINKLLFDLEG